MKFLFTHGCLLEIEMEFNPFEQICGMIRLDKTDMDQVCPILKALGHDNIKYQYMKGYK